MDRDAFAQLQSQNALRSIRQIIKVIELSPNTELKEVLMDRDDFAQQQSQDALSSIRQIIILKDLPLSLLINCTAKQN